MTGGFDGSQPPGGNSGARPVELMYCRVGAPHDDDDMKRFEAALLQHGDAIEAQRRNDAEWFENNLHRALRARPMIAAERAVFWPYLAGSGYSVVVGRIGKSRCRAAVRFSPAVTARLDAMSDHEIVAATPKGGAQ